MSTTPDSAADVAGPDTASTVTTEGIDELNARAWALRLSDAAEGLRVAERARRAARAAGYAHGEAYALRNAGACRCMLQDDDAALAELDAAGRMFEALHDSSGKASTLNWVGGVHRRRAEFSAALQAQLEALRLQRAAGDRYGEGDSLNNLGGIYFQTGDMARALEHFHAALKINEELGDEIGISDAVNNLGIIHGERGDYSLALEHHTRALVLKRRLGDAPGEAIALVNVGATHQAQGDYARALGCFEQALGLTRKIGHRFIETTVLQALGDTHRMSGDPTVALGYFWESVDVARAAGAVYPETDTRISIGQALVALGRAGEAITELRGALALAERIDALRLVYAAHRALADAHEAAGDASAALLHFREYHRVEGEVFSTESERRIQTIIAQAEVERSHHEAELLRARNNELIAADAEKARLLEVLGRQAAELDRLSREDALTGLFNRRHVDEALALEWERARRFGRDLTVVMADLDHFKAVNDRFSHAVGDRVLREVATILREGTRAVDVAGRWGGEELVLLLVETPPERAAHLCEKLRAAIEAYDWSAVAPGLEVTVSMGVAGNAEAADPAALLAAADARLYEAKRAGRNRIVG
jgi:diguanylate cyclase (GGDEF)-like protein